MKKEYTNLSLELKMLGGTEDYHVLEAIASTPDIDFGGDIVLQEAMVNSFDTYGLPKFLHQHDQKQMPLGSFITYRTEGDKTILKAHIPKVENDPFTKRLISLIKMNAYGGLSIGFFTLKSTEDSQGIRTLKEIQVFETSLVTIPMNQFAEILSVKAVGMGMSEKELTELKDIFEQKTNKGIDMKLEVKGQMLGELIRTKLDMLESGNEDFDRKLMIERVAYYMGVDVPYVEAIIAGDKDVIDQSKMYELSWMTGLAFDQIATVAKADIVMTVEAKDISNLKELEGFLKEKGLSKKESQTILSKNIEFKRLSDLSEKEEKRLSDLSAKQNKMDELALKQFNLELTKKMEP